MTLDEFMNTKLFGILFSLFSLCALVYFSFSTGKSVGYQRGWQAGRTENPKPEVLVVTEYVYDNKRIARFDPRNPDIFLLINYEKNTISRVPVNEELKKEVVVDSEGKHGR